MKLAYVMSETRGATDRALETAAGRLLGCGLKLCGAVQTNSERPSQHHCDMDVWVLPDGPAFRISQQLGAGSHGCRLDPSALEGAVAAVTDSFAGDVDVLIINKFGKHEADGRGFREVIAEALAQDIPVVVGVNGLNHAAFLDYAGGDVPRLPADPSAIAAWVLDLRFVTHAVA